MSMPTLLITGATGNVGCALLPQLKGRDARLLADSTTGQSVDGVPGRAVDFNDGTALGRALAGVDTAFIVIPPNPHMLGTAASVAEAARTAGVTHLVRVSGPAPIRRRPTPSGACSARATDTSRAAGSPRR